MRLRTRGFTLVEVVLALGLLTFVGVALMALLPVGIRSNQVSAEESEAANLLTMLESDLRGTHPSANSGKSRHFGLTLPYTLNAGGQTVLNTAVQINTFSPSYSTGWTDRGAVVPYTATSHPRYQASVIYTQLPTATTPGSPIQARLIVNWPAISAQSPASLTSPKSVSGFVETWVTFPSP